MRMFYSSKHICIYCITGHTLHQKAPQRQKGVYTVQQTGTLFHPRLWDVLVWDSGDKCCVQTVYVISSDLPCIKRLFKDTKASIHWSAAKNKELPASCCLANKPVVNRSPCPQYGSNTTSKNRYSGDTYRTIFEYLLEIKHERSYPGRASSRPRIVQPHPAPSRPAALPRRVSASAAPLVACANLGIEF